ncbi:SDR family NAD(P)-dependent oxidoreductase [Capillimicrobium parvum]|uniref:Dihydroanticapsin 7-dehydrogenase n=1 Tax=Capillimicrobium parvum TaxID=2884022 RepID=A0A9E6XTW5_9ACTN|nr:SDR family oxidoreductase [Capillimicrobium parvum]UGS34374.1 Dihydroanticapsin 7-dehydrogenase [Capillimicrobium parvum]
MTAARSAGDRTTKRRDRVALVTGGGSGIGEATVRRLVADGATVAVLDVREAEADRVVQSLPAGSGWAVGCDVSRPAEVDDAVRKVIELAGGRLDAVVNCAGIGTEGSIGDLELDDWHRTLAVNLTGPMLVIRAALPALTAGGAGSVVNIASAAGRRAIAGFAAYSASKAGLIMLTQQAAVDYGAAGVRFNVICPGWVRTAMSTADMEAVKQMRGGTTEEAFTWVSRHTPLQRVSDPSEIASIVAFLAGADSSYVSGAVIAADGGSSVIEVSTLMT